MNHTYSVHNSTSLQIPAEMEKPHFARTFYILNTIMSSYSGGIHFCNKTEYLDLQNGGVFFSFPHSPSLSRL